MPGTDQTTLDKAAQDLLALGLNHIAYVKGVEVDGQRLYAVHAADGSRVTVLPKREVAIAVILGNNMEPMSVH